MVCRLEPDVRQDLILCAMIVHILQDHNVISLQKLAQWLGTDETAIETALAALEKNQGCAGHGRKAM